MRAIDRQILVYLITAIGLVLWYTFGLPYAIGCGSTFGLILALGSLFGPIVIGLLHIWEILLQQRRR